MKKKEYCNKHCEYYSNYCCSNDWHDLFEKNGIFSGYAIGYGWKGVWR